MGKAASSTNPPKGDTLTETVKTARAPRKAISHKKGSVPKPRRPYKSMAQEKLVTKHQQAYEKASVARQRLEKLEIKVNRFDAELKLRATAAVDEGAADGYGSSDSSVEDSEAPKLQREDTHLHD